MTAPTDTTEDTTPEPLWMRCGPRGDEMVPWDDLTDDEKHAAVAFHNKLHGIET
jgi:hypothetical protein